MIGSINSGTSLIHVVNGSNSGPYISPGSVSAGMVRWNSNTNQLEVNDGNVWVSMNMGHATIMLDPEVEKIINWAKKAMQEEYELEQMIKQYPALGKAKENFDLIFNMVKDEYKSSL